MKLKHIKLFENFVNKTDVPSESIVPPMPHELSVLKKQYMDSMSDEALDNFENKAVELDYSPALLMYGVNIFFWDYSEEDWDNMTGIRGLGRKIQLAPDDTRMTVIYGELKKNGINTSELKDRLDKFMETWEPED